MPHETELKTVFERRRAVHMRADAVEDGALAGWSGIHPVWARSRGRHRGIGARLI